MAEKKNRSRFVVRFNPSEFDSLSDVIERLGGTQFVGERLMKWFGSQDPLVQAMILGQVPATDDLIELVLGRLASPKNRGTGRTAHTDASGTTRIRK